MSTSRARLVALHQEREWRRCRNDVVYFLEHYWHIKHPSRGRILFKLRPEQLEGLAHWRANRYSLTLKARQIGWSTLVAGYEFWRVYFHDDVSVLFISKGEREAKQLLDKSKYGYRHMPEWMRLKGPRRVTDTNEELAFSNESKIASRPSASDPARGESATDVVVDEWAFLPNPEEAWGSIEPVADVGGRIIGLSTANGAGEFFHTTWVKARANENEFKPLFMSWRADSTRDQEWYDRKKRSMAATPWLLHQEYPDNEDEAFLRSGRAVMDLDMLKEHVDPHITPPLATGWLEREGLGIGLKFRPTTNPDEPGPLAIWQYPEARHAYGIGADVAEGLEHGDFSSAHVVDSKTGEIVAHWHGHVDPDLFGESVLDALGRFYNAGLQIVEANNHGLTTITALRRKLYPRIFRRKQLNSTNKKASAQYGWATNVATKPVMIDELVRAIRDDAIILHDRDTLSELRTFVRDDKGRMSGSPYDDRVISLALAVQSLQWIHAPEYRPDVDDTWSHGWFGRGGGPKRPAYKPWVVGANQVRPKR